MPPKLTNTQPSVASSAYRRAAEREAPAPDDVPLRALTTAGRSTATHQPGAGTALTLTRAGAAGRTPETQALEAQMTREGVTLEELHSMLPTGGRFDQAAAHGRPVTTFSDVAGFITLPVSTASIKDAEKWPVISDKALEGGHYVDRHFVVGYGNRLVSMQDVQAFFNPSSQASRDAIGNKSFKEWMRVKSAASTLYARTRAAQADRPVMQLPPNARPFPSDPSWTDSEQGMHAYGQTGTRKMRDDAGNETLVVSDFKTGYVAYNPTENGLHFIITSPEKNHQVGRPRELRNNRLVPVSTNIEGAEIGRLDGILDIETLGPKGSEDGVKLAALRWPRDQSNADKVWRITYENNAVHEVTFTATGPRLVPIFPAPAQRSAMRPLDAQHVDMSMLSYDGSNTGPFGSRAGYANPQLILANGDRYPAALVDQDPTSFGAQAKALAKGIGELMTLGPAAGNNPGMTAAVFNTILQALTTAVFAGGSAAVAEHLRGPGTFIPGAHSFSASGSGPVTPQRLAGAVALIVLAQNALTKLFNLAYENTLPQSVKSKAELYGQFNNELLLPFVGEFVRQFLNYGLEKLAKVPRGNYKDVLMCFAGAAATSLVQAMRNRSGNPENHPALDMLGKLAQFLVGDLVPRSMGAVVGNPHGAGLNGKDLSEAILNRLSARGIDKAVAPVLHSLFNSLGWFGPNAGAHDAQLNAEHRQGKLAAVQSINQELSTTLDRLLESAWDAASNDTGIVGKTTHAAHRATHATRQFTDSLGIGSRATNLIELKEVTDAKQFHALAGPARQQYLREQSEAITARVAASAGVRNGARPIHNNVAELPLAMQAQSTTLLNKRQTDLEHGMPGPLYPLRPASNMLGPAVPYYAEASTVLGGKSERVDQTMTTFTREPVKDINPIHLELASAPGMPIPGKAPAPGKDQAGLRPLTVSIQRGVEKSVVKYTKQSGPFHYLQRWDETGQVRHTPIADGIDARTRVVNERGNTTGDPDRQVSGMDVLRVNFGALHGQQYAGPLMRAVVSEAPYLQPGEAGPENALRQGDLVSLTEIFSTTSSSLLAASFLAPQGFNAAAVAHRSRIVIDGGGHQPVATSIANLTELKQAETIFTPGTAFMIAKVVRDPVKPEDGAENLGQVVHFKRVNLWEMEDKYRTWHAAVAEGEDAVRKRLERGPDNTTALAANGLRIEDGDLMMHPLTGNFYKFNASNCMQPDFHGSKNYFLGKPIETDPGKTGRTRFPFTSESSTRGMRHEINMRLFSGDPDVPFMNDLTKNHAYEVDKCHAGYYDTSDKTRQTDQVRRVAQYRAEDTARLDAIKARARVVADQLNRMGIAQAFAEPTSAERAGGQRFPGHVLAQVVASAMRQPLRVVAVDPQGKPETEQGKLKLTADLMSTFDKIALQHDPEGATMIGVGRHGYYAIQERGGKTQAIPVRMSGAGHTPGNLLHVILASSTQAAAQFYALGSVVAKKAASSAKMPGQFPVDEEDAQTAAEEQSAGVEKLLDRLKNYAAADYLPMQHWVAGFDGQGDGADAFPVPATPTAVASGTGRIEEVDEDEDEDAITVLPPKR